MNPNRSERKRQAIMEAATQLFLENGYTGTSMDQIAARAMVSKLTVYKNFADKQQLFAAMTMTVAQAVDRRGAALSRARPQLLRACPGTRAEGPCHRLPAADRARPAAHR